MATRGDSSPRVALVTGANRGLGFETVRRLCKQFKGTVILTSCNGGKGMRAVERLEQEGLSPKFLQLDVCSMESIKAAKQVVEEQYGRLDILVHSAGLILTKEEGYSLPYRAKVSVDTIYYGMLNTTRAFLPLLQPYGRVVSLGSENGSLLQVVSAELQQAFTSRGLTIDSLSQLMDQYVQDCAAGHPEVNGWPAEDFLDDAYSVSALGRIILNKLLARLYGKNKQVDLQFICVSPGWVSTDIGGPLAPTTPEQGSALVVFAALLPPGRREFNGKFINSDHQELSWDMIVKNLAKYDEIYKAKMAKL